MDEAAGRPGLIVTVTDDPFGGAGDNKIGFLSGMAGDRIIRVFVRNEQTDPNAGGGDMTVGTDKFRGKEIGGNLVAQPLTFPMRPVDEIPAFVDQPCQRRGTLKLAAQCQKRPRIGAGLCGMPRLVAGGPESG